MAGRLETLRKSSWMRVAAMLGALSDADWSVEKTVMKDKASISPSVIIAKCQVDWPGKAWHKSVGSINFGYGHGHGHNSYNGPGIGLLTPPPLFTNISGAANFGTAGRSCHTHFGPSPSANHKLCEAHNWRLDHDTEDCYPLRDLRRKLANKNRSQRGRGRGRGGYLRGARANVMEVMLPDDNPNAIPVKEKGEGNVNSTMAGPTSDAFDYLSYCVKSFSIATLESSHSATSNSLVDANALTSPISAKTFTMHPDSGTNYHTSGNQSIFLSLSDLPVPIPIKFGNGQCLSAAKEGLIQLTDDVTLSHVLYVPGLNVNLTATPWKYEWTITPNLMTLRNRAHPELVYCVAKRIDGLYNAVFSRASLAKVHVIRADQLAIMALHRKLGHAGRNTIGKVIALEEWFELAILTTSNAQPASEAKVCGCHPNRIIQTSNEPANPLNGSRSIFGVLVACPQQGERFSLQQSSMTTPDFSKYSH